MGSSSSWLGTNLAACGGRDWAAPLWWGSDTFCYLGDSSAGTFPSWGRRPGSHGCVPLLSTQESLESALMGTHQELEMFGSQPAYPEKLLHKKESLQNQLINIRVELSQASTVTGSPFRQPRAVARTVPHLHGPFSPSCKK